MRLNSVQSIPAAVVNALPRDCMITPVASATCGCWRMTSTTFSGIGAVPREVLASIIGNSESEQLITRARHDLRQRIGLLLDEELLRFGEVISEAGQVDAVAAVRLYQAEYSLEAAR